MKKMVMVGVAIFLCMALAAQGQTESAGEPVEILISAAASLTDCMNELKSAYTAAHPLVTVKANYGSSGALQQQIEQGAPADIFFSAGAKQMQALKDKGLMDDATIQDLLENKLVLIVPKGTTPIASLQDLANSGVKRIAVGDPKSVPAGQYADEAFRSLGLLDAVKDKLVYAKDVREVLSWVETGNVQAGLVYETDAKISPNVTITAVAPEGSHKKVIYPVGVLKDSKHPDVAKDFLSFLFSESSKEVFAKYGFTVI